jgi:hypothetical protein
LNLETGLVSPQFHVSFDDHFETTRKGASVLLPASKWQEKAHFVEVKSDTPPPKELSASKLRKSHAEPPPSVVPANERDKSRQKVRRKRPEVETSTTPIMEPPMQGLEQSPVMTRSGRISKPPTRLIEVFDATLTSHEETTDPELTNPIFAFAASADPDTMYLKEAMRQPDREKFIEAMKKEIKDHTDNKHWRIVHRSTIPKGTPILPAVWSMKRKRRIATREIYKWKARLTVHGGRQKKGVNYWETYAPLVQWSTTRLFLTLSVLRGWHCRQLDFVLAYTQADPECDIYMAIPQGFTVECRAKDYALKLEKNL